MRPAGLQAVERAQQNGRWTAAYDSLRQARVPSDLQVALDQHANAKAFFATLNSQNRYAILHRLQTVRKAETRAKRIEQFIRMLEEHKKLIPKCLEALLNPTVALSPSARTRQDAA